MLYTKRKLITEALKRMRVVGMVEDVPAEEMERAAGIYDTKLEDWRDRNLVYWTNTNYDTEEIPGAVFEVLVALMINATEAQYGQNTQLSILERQAVEDRLLKGIRRHTHMQSDNRQVEVEYY